MKNKFSLMIHGGAGAIQDVNVYRPSLSKILIVGQRMLAKGKRAIDVVEKCVALLEDDPLYNAGKGSVLNEKGAVEMDAAIMDGFGLCCGAVAAVTGVKNPVHLARLVMDRSHHVMLIGVGACKFGDIYGIERENIKYFIVPKRVEQWKQARKKDRIVLDHSSVHTDKKMGTVGAVAMDNMGNLAAATSTGGIVNKKYGRVGDTPIIGAGTYADNSTCAVSATGFGEQFIRSVLAKHVSEIIRYEKKTATQAAHMAIEYFIKSVQGLGGIIVIDRKGNMGVSHSTPSMLYGFVSDSKKVKLGF